MACGTVVLQEVDFIWNGEATEVLLTGDFVGWDSKVPLLKGSDGAFHIKQATFLSFFLSYLNVD